MKIEKIKPIPKYILERIHKQDKQYCSVRNGCARYYAYLTKNDGELVKVTVAVKCYRGKWYCKQCAIHGIHSDHCFIKDMKFSYMAGYTVGWYYDGLSTRKCWYEIGEWGYQRDSLFDMYAPVVNLDYLKKLPAYRYSAIEQYTYIDVLQYLRLYEKYPFMENLVKGGFQQICMSKMILSLIAKDKNFVKWLRQNKEKITNNYYYKDVIINAYKKKQPLDKLQEEKRLVLKYSHDETYHNVLREIPSNHKNRLIKYLVEKSISINTYRDYLFACQELGLDMNDTKNLFPHDFAHWHDIRTDEYRTLKATRDEERRKELYDAFASVAQKYLPLQYDKQQNYIVIIAKSPAELIVEGDTLHHCVGKMGYDQRFAREESLIFFIRTKEQPDTPFVTLEYSPKKRSILQYHGENNRMPDEATADFIKNVWLPYANRHAKKLIA